MYSLQITQVEMDNIFIMNSSRCTSIQITTKGQISTKTLLSTLNFLPSFIGANKPTEFFFWCAQVKSTPGHVGPYFQTNKEREIGKENWIQISMTSRGSWTFVSFICILVKLKENIQYHFIHTAIPVAIS